MEENQNWMGVSGMRKQGKIMSELKQIHDVIMCIGEVKEPLESDTHTVREVKRLALRVRQNDRDAARYRAYREVISKGDLIGTDDIEEFDRKFDKIMGLE